MPDQTEKPSNAVRWQWSAFAVLSPYQLAAVLRLRAEVFVVEQNCAYQDVDGLDEHAWHLLGWQERSGSQGLADAPGALAAYMRVVFPGKKFAEPSIGRVVVSPHRRGCQLGRELMQQGIARTEQVWAATPIRISAQQHLERFYSSLGFAACSASYLEDGIPHIEMLRPGSSIALSDEG